MGRGYGEDMERSETVMDKSTTSFDPRDREVYVAEPEGTAVNLKWTGAKLKCPRCNDFHRRVQRLEGDFLRDQIERERARLEKQSDYAHANLVRARGRMDELRDAERRKEIIMLRVVSFVAIILAMAAMFVIGKGVG